MLQPCRITLVVEPHQESVLAGRGVGGDTAQVSRADVRTLGVKQTFVFAEAHVIHSQLDRGSVDGVSGRLTVTEPSTRRHVRDIGCCPSLLFCFCLKPEKHKSRKVNSLLCPLSCDIPLGCSFFTGPWTVTWTVTRSSLRVLRQVNPPPSKPLPPLSLWHSGAFQHSCGPLPTSKTHPRTPPSRTRKWTTGSGPFITRIIHHPAWAAFGKICTKG